MSKYSYYITIILTSLFTNSIAKAGGLGEQQYADLYNLQPMSSVHGKDVKKCLAAWGSNSPFKKTSKLKFRVIEADVKLFGLGSDVYDKASTSYPQLILVASAVNVMGKSTIHLLNPNGWYCLEGKVTVMGKTTINLACKASLATTNDSTTVLGASRGSGNSGTTVMGKTVIKRNCKQN